MIKRLLFNRIDILGDDHSVDQTVKGASSIFPHTTDPTTTFMDDTKMVAKEALDLVLLHSVKEHGLFHRRSHLGSTMKQHLSAQGVVLTFLQSSTQSRFGWDCKNAAALP